MDSIRRVIETGASFLDVGTFSDTKLIQQCIDEITTPEEGEAMPKILTGPEVVVFGRTVRQPRDVGFFSNVSSGYRYSGKCMAARQLTDGLQELLNRVNGQFGSNFDGILVNRYVDGSKYICAHSDDEEGCDKAGGVVALSYGATRKFRIRDKVTKKKVQDVPLVSGELVHMGGAFQREFTHEIPKELRVKEVRYSFTFRTHSV